MARRLLFDGALRELGLLPLESSGFTSAVAQNQEAQSQALTGLLFIDSDVDQSQKAQSQQSSGVFFIDCNVLQSQRAQGQDIVCVTDAVDPSKEVIFSGGTWYREPDKPKQIVRGRVIQRQAVQDENGLLIYAIGANGFTKQAHAVENNRGMAGVFGKAESGNHRAIVKSKGYIKTAEDEILELLQLLSA